MKCAVEGCIREASPDCGFQQMGTVGEMEIKTSGLLCKECFQQAMNGGRKEQQEYCAGCGIAFWKRITGEPVLTHTLNEKKYCTACFKKQEANKEKCVNCEEEISGTPQWYSGYPWCDECFFNEHEPKKEKCADCGKEFSKLFSKPYCIECFQRRQNQQKDRTPNGFWEELFGNQTYSARREYSFSADQMEEDIARMRNFFGGSAHFFSGSTVGQQQQTKTSGSYTYLPGDVKEAFKVLGIEPIKNAEAIKKAYKALALVKHPDTGGSHQDMVKLNKAKDVALKWAGGK